MRTLTISDPAHLPADSAAAFDPLSLPWHSAFWAEDPSWTNPGDGNAVSSWRNAGTDGTAATQATGTKQPLYRASVAALNNKPAVDFDGSNDRLVANVADIVSNPWTIVAVISHDDNGTDGVVGLGQTNSHVIFNGSVYRLGSGGSNVLTSTGPQTCLLVGVGNQFSSSLEANGAASGAITDGNSVGSQGIAEVEIGNRLDGLPFDGKIAFVGILASAITAPQRASIEAWVTTQYGLTIT